MRIYYLDGINQLQKPQRKHKWFMGARNTTKSNKDFFIFV